MSWQPENKSETSLIPGKDVEANFGSLTTKNLTPWCVNIIFLHFRFVNYDYSNSVYKVRTVFGGLDVYLQV